MSTISLSLDDDVSVGIHRIPTEQYNKLKESNKDNLLNLSEDIDLSYFTILIGSIDITFYKGRDVVPIEDISNTEEGEKPND